jgi:hypothetical protein
MSLRTREQESNPPLVKFLRKQGLAVLAILAATFGICYMTLNDMGGSYQGSSALTGPVQLRIERGGDSISGAMTLMGDIKMEIADGRILSNGSMELAFQPPKVSNPVLSARIGKWQNPSFIGRVEPWKLNGLTLEVNTLNGTFTNGETDVPLHMSRSMAASLFRSLWWER